MVDARGAAKTTQRTHNSTQETILLYNIYWLT